MNTQIMAVANRRAFGKTTTCATGDWTGQPERKCLGAPARQPNYAWGRAGQAALLPFGAMGCILMDEPLSPAGYPAPL